MIAPAPTSKQGGRSILSRHCKARPRASFCEGGRWRKKQGVLSFKAKSVRYNVSLHKYSPASSLNTGESIILSMSQSAGIIVDFKSPRPLILILVSCLPELSGMRKSRISFARISILGNSAFSASPICKIASYLLVRNKLETALDPDSSTDNIRDSITQSLTISPSSNFAISSEILERCSPKGSNPVTNIRPCTFGLNKCSSMRFASPH